MTACIERVEELRSLLGLSQAQFVDRVGRTRSVFSNWKKDGAPDRDTLWAMADRWQVDDDSLRGRDGTDRLEPSAAQVGAQRRILQELSGRNHPGDTADRLSTVWALLQKYNPGFTLSGWLDWLQWTESDLGGTPGDIQVQGAAFVLGWYDGAQMWREWFRSGAAASLVAADDKEAMELGHLCQQLGLDKVEIRRLSRLAAAIK